MPYQNQLFVVLFIPGIEEGVTESVARSQNQSVEDSNLRLIKDHQIVDLVGVLNPVIHPPLAQNSF